MESIKQVLINRDGVTELEADNMIQEAKDQLADSIANGDFEEAYDICQDQFGLEPDYLLELL